jgi:FemAB-related protein (PEP-CTERM system-associated)
MQGRPMMLTVREPTAADEADWDRFVSVCPSATFFHRLGWRRLIARSYRHQSHYRLAIRDGRIVGVLPLIQVKSRLFGHALISTGFGAYGGIAATDDGAMKALAADAERLGRELSVDYVELRHQLPAALGGWLTKDHVYATFRQHLYGDESANMKLIPAKTRNRIRRSLKNNLRFETNADIGTFYSIYAESLHNLGTPVPPKRFFLHLRDEFSDSLEVSVVHGPQGPIATTISFVFRDQIAPYYTGALPIARPLHAYDFLYWQIMCDAAGRDFRVFDLGRSKYTTGAFDYKVYWGFKPEPLHYQYYLIRGSKVPDINPLNPKFRLFVSGWKRLPLRVANCFGPYLARQLG